MLFRGMVFPADVIGSTHGEHAASGDQWVLTQVVPARREIVRGRAVFNSPDRRYYLWNMGRGILTE